MFEEELSSMTFGEVDPLMRSKFSHRLSAVNVWRERAWRLERQHTVKYSIVSYDLSVGRF